jgi:uncharacterized protein (DUF305 family)
VKQHYVRFGVTMVVSLALMFLLSMSMVRTFDHFYLNPSNFYMALIMVAAMGVVMMVVMSSMFDSKRLNIVLYATFTVLFAGAFALGRTETFVGNEGFLKSMIPHHSRAILVCQEADITDPEIIRLCEQIVEAQQEEIAQMEEILDRY